MAFHVLDSNLPNDLVDFIAHEVHHANLENVLSGVNSELRKALSETRSSLIPYLRGVFPDMVLGGAFMNTYYMNLYSLSRHHFIVHVHYFATGNRALLEGKVCGADVKIVAAYGDDVETSTFLPYLEKYVFRKKLRIAHIPKPQRICVDWNTLMRNHLWRAQPLM